MVAGLEPLKAQLGWMPDGFFTPGRGLGWNGCDSLLDASPFLPAELPVADLGLPRNMAVSG